MPITTTLDRCDGPECPRCGCRDCFVLQEPSARGWWASGRARCRHCGTPFGFRAVGDAIEPPVSPPPFLSPPLTPLTPPLPQSPAVFAPVPVVPVVSPSPPPSPDPTACPDCGQTAKTYSTKGRTQYRRCPDCGRRFKTTKR